jgi:type VI secretion system protein ImpJ
MKQLLPVLWTKGTFLTPQHLQVQDRFLEDGLSFRLDALKFCAWGFTELVIDQALLAEGQLVVLRASGIFPDGLLFDIPDSDAAPPSKMLAEFFDARTNSLDVYLSIPDYRPRGLNVSQGQRDQGTRYLAEVTSFRDENTGKSEKPVQIARKNLRFLMENENRDGSSVLRIANVERTAAGTFRLNPGFVAPLLEIRSSEYVMGMLGGILEILSAKSTQLSGSRRQRNQSMAEFTSADIANFWLLYTINSFFPVLNHLFEAQSAHPEELYSALSSLAGSLSTFSTRIRPRDLPLYVHDSLGQLFAELDRTLRMLLETVVATNLISLPLKKVKDSIYATALEDERYLSGAVLYLAVHADVSEETLIRRAPQLVKLCSATQIEHLVKNALPGISIKHMTNPPSAIPMKLKYQYFTLNQAGPAWEAVTRARDFAAYIPGDFPNPDLELLILLPQAP